MAIPTKGRRTITVDGVEFHYKINFERSERAVIQDASGCGAFLFVFPFAIMKPVHVTDAIRFGLSKGWLHGQTGKDCWLAFNVDSDGKSLFEFIPNDDLRVVTYRTRGELPENLDKSHYPDSRKWYERPIVNPREE